MSAAALWRNASMTMQNLSDTESIPYLEIVQPNQYFSPRKFSHREHEVALHANSPYLDALGKGAPHLIAHFPLMMTRGIQFRSVIHIFDDVESPVYSDDFSHYNQTGNEILADFVAEHVIDTLRSSSHR